MNFWRKKLLPIWYNVTNTRKDPFFFLVKNEKGRVKGERAVLVKGHLCD